MADNVNEEVPASVETSDRGLLDFMKKKEEQKPQEETFASEFDHKVHVSEADCKKDEEEKKHGGLLEKLHRSDSSSSSSSDEGDDEEKKKRKKEKKEKKGLKEKLKEKLPGHKDEDTNVPIEKCDEEKEKPHVHEVVYSEPSHVQDQDHEKKGFLDKIKDKLPGHNKADDQHVSAAPMVAEPCVESEGKDKKGFLEKIKDKIPGFSSKSSEEKKEHEEKKEGH